MSQEWHFCDELIANRRLALHCTELIEEQNKRSLEIRNDTMAIELQLKELESITDSDRIKGLQQLQNQIETESNNIMHLMTGIASTKQQVDTHINELRVHTHELSEIKNVDKQAALQKLQRTDEATYAATLWLRENKHRFRGAIHEPMMLLITPRSAAYAKYIEEHVPKRDLLAFTFTDERDIHEFMKCVQEELKVTVNSVLLTKFGAPIPSLDIAKYEKYGIQWFLKDLFTAPQDIIRFLCTRYSVHKIPGGGEDLMKYTEAIIRKEGFTKFYAGDNCLSTLNVIDLLNTRVHDKNILMAVDETKRDEVRHKIRQSLDQKIRYEEAIQILETNLNIAKEKVTNLESASSKIRCQIEKKDIFQKRISHNRQILQVFRKQRNTLGKQTE